MIGDRGESGRLDLPEARGANPSSAANAASIKDSLYAVRTNKIGEEEEWNNLPPRARAVGPTCAQ